MEKPAWTAAGVAIGLGIVLQTAVAEPIQIQVHGGVLVGAAENGVEVFKGVPYAAPPVGPLRWALPRPADAWVGAREANDFGPSCMQFTPPRHIPPDSRAAQVSEDCLTLNVWAPEHAQHAPVMVWVHGGGNRNGTSADVYYDGSAFARDGIVLVSLNYRLGVLGFFAYRGEANFGLWDQIAALRWVRDNINAFGGNPANITLFGESAGGQDTLALMAATPARGLFQKAIVESGGGGWGPPPTLAESEAFVTAWAAQFAAPGVTATPDMLLTMSAQTLVERGEQSEDWGPVVEGHLLAEPPLNAFAKGHTQRVPLIIGTNGEEGSVLGPEDHTEAMFPRLKSDDLAKLKALYGAQATSDSAFAQLVFRDGYFAGPARWIASQVTRAGVPAYLYQFEYVLSVLQGRRAGAYHGSEIPFVFEHWPTERLTDTDLRVGHGLHDCWVSFARTAKPQCAQAPNWVPFSRDGRGMVFDAHPSVRPLEDRAALDLLEAKLRAAP